MNFSTALRLNDVDDYIAPAQSCIKPVKLPQVDHKTTSITVGADGDYVGTNANGVRYTLSKAKIDLNDCLACSGCITTAETILVSQHSVLNFLDVLRNNQSISHNNTKREIFVALSPQSIVSISSTICEESCEYINIRNSFLKWRSNHLHCNHTNAEMFKLYCEIVLHSNGVEHVFDTTLSRDLSLLKSAEEFVEAWQSISDPTSNYKPKIPILTGICPGWVCFAEKTNFKTASSTNEQRDEYFLLNHLSRVRSPQQLLAGYLKRASSNLKPYTVFVMPCYDKKLEASRSEFEIQSVDGVEKEADLVLGTNEFIKVLDILVSNFEKHSFISIDAGVIDNSSMYRHPGSGSGGYAFSVLRNAAEVIYGIQLKQDVPADERILVRYLGNSDMMEILLFESSTVLEAVRSHNLSSRTPYRMGNFKQQPLFSFLVANGFRNIQTVVQQFKRVYSKAQQCTETRIIHSAFPFDYIEIMACPRGCLNGGAQLKPASNPEQLFSNYFSMEVKPMMTSEKSKEMLTLVQQKLTNDFFLTNYRRVPKIDIINPSSLKW